MIAGLALLRNPELLLGEGDHCLPQWGACEVTEVINVSYCSLGTMITDQ